LAERITKQMLGIETRKKILYLDQSFFSLAARKQPPAWVQDVIAAITELLDLQLLAVPYSFSHVAEADLYKGRDSLVSFIQRLSRGHDFWPYYKVEERQTLKAFEAFLAGRPTAYVREERDAISGDLHDWDGDYIVTVFTHESDYERKRESKHTSVNALLDAIEPWGTSSRTFEEDMELEFQDAARIYADDYATKAARLYLRDFAALIDSPISAEVVGNLITVAQAVKADPKSIGAFLSSQHFRETPCRQLSARLYSAFKERLRKKAVVLPASREAREKKYSGLMFDVQHASTYAPYCDAFFADNAMAELMNYYRVAVEKTYGCRVFCASTRNALLAWLNSIKTSMTPEHVDGLRWAYVRYRKLDKA
jgi:hypothetical protein